MMGINVNRTISFTFLIAGALAGAAGLLYSLYVTTVRFDQGFQLGLIAFTAAVLGGIGNLPGAVLGAILIGLIQAFNEGLNWHAPGSDWTQSIVFTILILILVFRPGGPARRTHAGGRMSDRSRHRARDGAAPSRSACATSCAPAGRRCRTLQRAGDRRSGSSSVLAVLLFFARPLRSATPSSTIAALYWIHRLPPLPVGARRAGASSS